MGFRDSSQDILGFASMIPSRARQRLLDLAATQLPSGGANHQYQPLTKRGNAEIGSGFNDDPLWLIFAVSAYLKETGDLGLLDEQVPYGQRQWERDPTLRTPRTLRALHAREVGAPRTSPDWSRGLERLSQSELFLAELW